MRLSAIVAISEDSVIGRGGDLPWRLPDDLKRFRATTMGHPIVMGRKTWESIGRPLPGRTNVVVTRQPDYRAPGATVVHSLDEALARFRDADEVFVIGGEELFRLALPRVERLHVTRVHARVEGDVFFPPDAFVGFHLVAEERHAADERHEHPFSFLLYERS